MVNFMIFFLQEEIRQSTYFEQFYTPILGFVLTLLLNQFMTEYRQWKTSDTNMQYITNLWNLNDMIYLLLNFTVILMNILGYFGIVTIESAR